MSSTARVAPASRLIGLLEQRGGTHAVVYAHEDDDELLAAAARIEQRPPASLPRLPDTLASPYHTD
jgi:hypothetical protein